MAEHDGYPKIQLPLEPEPFGTLSIDDYAELAKAEYVVRCMQHAIILPRQRREFEAELELGRKSGWKIKRN